MPDPQLEVRVRIGAWRDVRPYGPPDQEMAVEVSDGQVSTVTGCCLRHHQVEELGPQYLDHMRTKTIHEAISTFLDERARADAALREVAAASFDHRPNDLMPEDFYA
jgi:hypothetical protein